ncbi:AAA family ATPase [Pseudomonas aeruginosa]|uniref:ATP-dependent endonuclease n=1 Tax=Pseudomonas aeruginosa TaxID=287 RepID=A0A367MG31_PSEAI|nr:AAA family ATPase [Pseudomonas aeruginosa]EKW4465680.1 AAA family ATPase [Pseudomonas aeruginosa]MBG5460926.1 AAA family ATPase [Pseudomonas aeruginosa]MBG6702472.1 AAA family ATPase [Pseudomonas aeruginosa]MBG7216381.1 AAA family ATPase [Pseudomonas aeruginosa]MBG7242227.1 AAA family ATPase [Pseudomonas aeruginosa]
MAGENRSKLLSMTVRNIGCIGNEGVEVKLDRVVCLVGKNNAGKSTILRAYQLARGSENFVPARDRYQHADNDQPSEIFLEVHIPEGMGNVDAKWKQEQDGLLVVKSRWQWLPPSFQAVRTTWDPSAQDWSSDEKAGGADQVFRSRLPRALRIGSLDDAAKTEDMLLSIALSPLLSGIESERSDPGSDLAKAISSVSESMNLLGERHQEYFNSISGRVSEGFKRVFPSLDVKLNVGSAPLVPKISDLIKGGSSLRVKDGASDTALEQQGTGARRALFWAMLQVHNELNRDKEIRADYQKRLEKSLTEIQKKLNKPGKTDNADELKVEAADILAQLQAHLDGAPIPESPEDPAFPGYLLLIDEPENALHPMAARAAQRHLYKLAENPDWQVIMTTHSPYFINPFEDHTTIIRLERDGGDDRSPITPKTYTSDLIEFEGDDKQRLQALQHIDPSFSEVFFGSYPVIVEGDTEHAAFLSSIIERQHELIDRVTIIRARGKAIIVPLIRVLRHFKLDFGLIHDADSKYDKNGRNNGMWTENIKIRNEVLISRRAGSTIRHRVSVPDFERFLEADEASKDKPLNAYLMVKESDKLAEKIQALLLSLISSEQHEPYNDIGEDYSKTLNESVCSWAIRNGLNGDVRFFGQN